MTDVINFPRLRRPEPIDRSDPHEGRRLARDLTAALLAFNDTGLALKGFVACVVEMTDPEIRDLYRDKAFELLPKARAQIDALERLLSNHSTDPEAA